MRKNIFVAALALIGAVAFTSCVRESFENTTTPVGNLVNFTIKTGETQVKTYIEEVDGKYVPNWTKGDNLAVYIVGSEDASAQATFANTAESGRTAVFSGSAALEAGDYSVYAAYPARAYKSVSEEMVAQFEFPYIQFPAAASFDPKADLLVSVPKSVSLAGAENETVEINDMRFRRVGSIVKVVLKDNTGTLADDAIRSIYLETDQADAALSGVFDYDYKTEDAASTGMSVSNNHVTADLTRLTSPLALNGTNAVYLVVPPTTLQAGSKLLVNVKTDKHEIVKNITLPTDIKMPSSQVVTLNVNIDETCPIERVYFQDNFDWLYYYWDSFPSSDKDGIRDPISAGTTASQKQPNIWSKYSSTVGADFTARGYEDLNKDAKVLYVQENYLKMGKTNVHTGLELPEISFGSNPVDVELSFSYAVQDEAIEVVVEVFNAGRCADTGKAKSRRFFTDQDLTWITETVLLKDVTDETRIQIKPYLSAFDIAGTHRWFLDNIKVVSATSNDTNVFPVVWTFPDPSDSWVAGTDYAIVTNTGGSYLYSDTHAGKVTMVVPDNRENSAENKYVQAATLSNESRYEFCQYGVYKGSYWLFEVYDVVNPSGTYNIKYNTCSSASGPKYFCMEYSLDNGITWNEINTKQGQFYYNDNVDDSHGPMDITYTYWVHSGSQKELIDESFHLDEIATETTLLIRSKVAEDYRASKNGAIATNGSHRLGGNMIISFTPDAK